MNRTDFFVCNANYIFHISAAEEDHGGEYAHAVLMTLAWGLLAPIAIFSAVNRKLDTCKKPDECILKKEGKEVTFLCSKEKERKSGVEIKR